MISSLRQRLFGKPRNLRDPRLFHHVSLVAFFAWVGLGADGLSSSAYGPDEAFRHLDGHYYLAVFLAVALALTVFIISYGYSRIIEHFPSGGGGYVVASKLLGERAGLVSGSALLVDYVLTISISVASGANAVFAFLPPQWQQAKLTTEFVVIALLIVMNLRGVKESVLVLTPIFLVFLVTHVILIGGVVGSRLGEAGEVVREVRAGLHHDLVVDKMTWGALLLVFFRAYSLGGSSYTGIEAVSNGLAMMREPRVKTGRRTMVLMATSLALTAGGILLAFLLMHIEPQGDTPMNALLAEKFAAGWHVAGVGVGKAFVVTLLVSEGALLFVAAQTGFLDGPRVMSNMALDSWMPHQFAALSERLTMRNGVYLMGGAAIATLIYTKGSVDVLAVMYSINVFLTFSLSNLGMSRLWVKARSKDPGWAKHLSVHVLALVLCVGILVVTVLEKFTEGGWVTLMVTALTVVGCLFVRMHYRSVAGKLGHLGRETEKAIAGMPDVPPNAEELEPDRQTAVLLVGSYGGLGLSTLLQIDRVFPGQYRQVVFISAGVIDSGTFKGTEELHALEGSLRRQLEQYVTFARTKLGWAAEYDMVVGTEAVAEIERLCREVHLRYPRSVFFAGNLIFTQPTWWTRLLHNETAHAIQRRLEFDRLPMVVMPVRVL
ncbi:MAG TPA: APC family permease [Haliangiales bacterium]|nr:APC family permease [Haliangiales bacterium]